MNLPLKFTSQLIPGSSPDSSNFPPSLLVWNPEWAFTLPEGWTSFRLAMRKRSVGLLQRTEELGLSGPDFSTRVTERAFGGVYKTGTGYVAVPVRLTLPGSSSCKCPAIMCLVVIISWSLEQEPDWLTTHVRMTVQTTRAKGTGNLSMRKQTHWRIYETLVFHFYKLSWWLKMFPFLTLKTEMPRPNWVNEILSRIIYRNIKRVSDIQCFQAKMIISAPDNLNIQKIR